MGSITTRSSPPSKVIPKVTIYFLDYWPEKKFVLPTGETFTDWDTFEASVKETNPIPYWICIQGKKKESDPGMGMTEQKFLELYGTKET